MKCYVILKKCLGEEIKEKILPMETTRKEALREVRCVYNFTPKKERGSMNLILAYGLVEDGVFDYSDYTIVWANGREY